MSIFNFKAPRKRYEDAAQEMNVAFNDMEKRIESLSKELATLKDEKWKDETLANLKTEVEIYKRREARSLGFKLTEEQKQSVEDWKTKHLKEVHNFERHSGHVFGGAIGGNFEYHFCPTSLGDIGTCVCGVCFNKALVAAEGNKDIFYQKMKEFDGEFCFEDID